MEPGQIILADETAVRVRFRLYENERGGRVAAEQVGDFARLLECFNGDDRVLLQNHRGTWKAQVHIWEPDNLANPRAATFEFTVEGALLA